MRGRQISFCKWCGERIQSKTPRFVLSKTHTTSSNGVRLALLHVECGDKVAALLEQRYKSIKLKDTVA